jgi:glyoxylase-like metal-dependent hydrolase (beta-lactamase superfamily II)
MKIDRLILGAYQTNCYILRQSEADRDCLIIDTGLEAGELVDFLGRYKLNPVAVILTHGHADHVTGVAALRKSYPDIKVCIHKLDERMLTGARNTVSAIQGIPFGIESADFSLEEGDVIEQAGIKLKVLHTPGHTPGGISLYSKDEGIVFVGDTVFAGSVGRTDMPGGSTAQLLKSIKEKLCVLPDETVVYPGHGPVTTITQEKAHNPFLQ